MKVPPKRKGNSGETHYTSLCSPPSMKVPPKRKGNNLGAVELPVLTHPSMKGPPKRKGNLERSGGRSEYDPLNESPSEKEGKCCIWCAGRYRRVHPSMKVPPKRKGNCLNSFVRDFHFEPSMKVPPKRKGNLVATVPFAQLDMPLNESPSEKEGKSSPT